MPYKLRDESLGSQNTPVLGSPGGRSIANVRMYDLKRNQSDEEDKQRVEELKQSERKN